MARNDLNGKRPKIFWIIFLSILTIIMVVLLELGKHTVIGWILTVAAVAAYVILRIKVLNHKKRLMRFLSWICLIIVFGIILAVSWPPYRSIPAAKNAKGVTEVIHVEQGDLTGVVSEDGQVEIFCGIPYAEPPVGDLRWKEPVRAKAWEGVLEADNFAPMSMQSRSLPIYYTLVNIIGYHEFEISLDDNFREPVSEDSLYLNIWKPAGEQKDLPVLVYIHGGSLQTGQPSFGDYSGEGLAREGIIVVNMGYRLGIFGFFAHEDLAAESPNGTTGNYGLLDQIMALEWIRDNISAFGGDPGNVTIAGESAGAACVTALCTSPLAKGLFRRAIAESSTVVSPEPTHSFRSLEDAYAAAENTMERNSVTSIDELRAMPAEDLVDEMYVHHHMTVDGYVLEETPYESYMKGIHNEEAQLHGFNRDESGPFILFSQADSKNYEGRIDRYFGEYADEVKALYPGKTDEQAKKDWADIYTAVYFTYGHYCWQRLAQLNGIPSYVYYFTKSNGRLGTWHAGEEIYFYHNIKEDSKQFTDEDRALSDMMSQYFLNFIKTGDPNGGDLPEWTAYSGKDEVFEFGEHTGPVETPMTGLYEIFDRFYGFKYVK